MRPRGERMEMAEYQKLLPAGLKLDRAHRGAGFPSDEFEATDTRTSATAKRLVQFLPPPSTTDGWEEWPRWKPRLEAWLAERVGLQLSHVSLPLETDSTSPGGLYTVGHLHDEPLSKLMAERADALGPEAWPAIVEQVLAGLAEMHQRHLVHGDVRPRNIYVQSTDGPEHDVTVWLDGSVAGALAAWSEHRVEDPDSRVYRSFGVLATAATLSPSEDLRGLALTACELVLGGRQELLEHADGASSVEEFWARVEPALRHRLARQRRHGRLGALLAGTDPARRLVAVVAMLLGQPVLGPSGFGWQKSKGTLSAHVPPVDAGDVLRRLRTWDVAHRASERRRMAAVFVVAVVSCASSAYLAVRGWQQAAELAEARRTVADAGNQLANGKATIASHDNRIAELERQLDEAVVKQKNEELREIRAALAELKQQVAGLPPHLSGSGAPDVDQAAAEIGRRAKNAWKEKVTVKHPYQSSEVTKLYESWLAKEPAVARRIKEWRASVDSLRLRGKTWLASDAEFKRLHDSALAEPWEDWLGRANQRLATLSAAAKTWEQCAAPGTDPDKAIANEPDADVQRVLKGWYQALFTRTEWKVQLVSGASAAGAGEGTTRVVTITARTSDSTGKHDWILGDGTKYEAEYSYESSESPPGTLAVEWVPGGPIELTLEGPRSAWALGSYRPDIIFERFDGPLAPWALNAKHTLTSADGKTTLVVRVVNCPGPPRGWNVEAAAGKKLKRQANDVLSGAAN